MFRRISMTILTIVTLALGLGFTAAIAGAASSQFWSDVSPESITLTGDRPTVPDQFRAVRLDRDGLAAFLAQAPLEGTPAAAVRSVLTLPLPDGSLGRFSIVESPVMAPELQAQFPGIRTYAGYGLDDASAMVRLDLTQFGFHGLLFTAAGTVYIDPFQRGDIVNYQSYYKGDLHSDKILGGCTVVDDGMGEWVERQIPNADLRSGSELRTYRIAIAATGEYTAYYGGTVAGAMAGIVTSLNRVDGVYEKEVSIRMVLVPNNALIVYTNAATDPYTNNNGSTMLGQNQSTIDSVIGTANYDIGHVFSTGGGGIAGLGVVCRAGLKARGVTGSPAPIGDAYDIDYVAHEMGHQYAGNHPFNGNSSNCAGGNRNASTAYEPGSGSTIMAYAGICPPQDLQPHSDDYFHWINLQEIYIYTNAGLGNGCPVVTSTGVIDPTVNAGTGGFSIPLNTPFALTATATTTGTPTFCWEEADLGPAGHPNTPSGTAPIFRSFDPVASPTRTFPKLTDLLNNVHTIGELLPTYARALNFKCTVRDTQAGGVGVSKAALSFSVAAVGPFTVTSPNTVVDWPAGSAQTVTWDVAGTNAAPVNCQTVNILLSTNSGYNWDYVLASGVPNNGSAPVNLPPVPAAHARIKVEAADNIFFDVCNFNFVISQVSEDVSPVRTGSGMALYANRPNPFNPQTTISFQMPQAGEVSLRVYDPAGRMIRTLLEGTAGVGRHQVAWDGTDADGRNVSSGVYLYRLEAGGEHLSGRMTLLR